MPKSARSWAHGSTWREVFLTIFATTISIILTFGTAALLERCQRIENRKMSALMVMSNIENFSRNVDKMAQDMARCDSIGTWMRSLPKDSLDKIPPEEVAGIINEMLSLVNFMSHDKTAENIFGNSLETWKTMGSKNYLFIDRVGACFSEMNSDENNWNEWVNDYEVAIRQVTAQIGPGEHTLTKLLNDNAFRQKIEEFHVRKSWLDYVSAYIRFLNSKNMKLIGIEEDEVIAFTDKRAHENMTDKAEPTQADFRTDTLKPDSLYTLRPIIQHIDSILHR